MSKIDSFTGQYRFLSNFWYHDVYIPIGDSVYKASTNEHGYQALKAKNIIDFCDILRAKSPGEAKRMGRRIEIVENWNDLRLPVMEFLCRQKFSKDGLGPNLLDTGDATLEEGNSWGDEFWGITNAGRGLNHLGKILMKIRAELAESH